MRNKVAIIGGGTVNPIYNHVSLCSFARGGTARRLHKMFMDTKLEPELYLSRMAADSTQTSEFHTNDELQIVIDRLKADPETKVIVMTAAVCDYYCPAGGDDVERPTTEVGQSISIHAKKANKIVQSIRDNEHKHITLIAFKQTCGKTRDEMYLEGLRLHKQASANLVFVNDTKTKYNMIVVPEQAAYADGWGRNEALQELVEMTVARCHLSFTRSTVVSGDAISWDSELVPESLRAVVDHCIASNAYKPFNGSTVGHFACKVNENTFLTSIRRSNFNELSEVGLVKVVTDGPDHVTAYGFKPSVGGQSQRLIFDRHPDLDSIVHFHSPLKEDHADDIQTMSQREVECGSHECGENTANGLKKFGNLWAVYLSKHGPNIVFNRDIDPQEVIDFIERNFDLAEKTGGYNLEPNESKPGTHVTIASKADPLPALNPDWAGANARNHQRHY